MSIVYRAKFLQALRLLIDKGEVTLKDYVEGSKQKQMVLARQEFIRRFKQHILPKGFTKIRSYGYLSNRNRQQRINQVLSNMKLPLHRGLVGL